VLKKVREHPDHALRCIYDEWSGLGEIEVAHRIDDVAIRPSDLHRKSLKEDELAAAFGAFRREVKREKKP
jgi:hypothetical protein